MLGFLFKDRSKRIARIAASAAPLLEPGEEVQALVQVQTGRTAAANAAAVQDAFQRLSADWEAEGRVQSLAVLATERNVYVVTLTGLRLLDVGTVIHKQPIAGARVAVGDKVITIDDLELHVMENFEPHVAALRDLLTDSRPPG